ncbi:tyrosine-type recombinase/integrase [Variovorax guangxiensis]|uniref:tyrosine-type recombinase/integrase n=1 Tax=Variovorax guangxiensis TaxID=1775474 RepID=UPI00285A2DD5|nr:tyrosine-type recombinase/integrase [Variovorax guangxiensis]MDR6856218.1 integrase [Variovorax guangxiensis]
MTRTPQLLTKQTTRNKSPLRTNSAAVSVFSITPLSLFEEVPTDSLGQAFERWLSDQQAAGSLRQSSSIQVYRDMWGGFTAWCLGQSPVVTLASLDVRDLAAFQAARFGMKSADLSLSPRHALRLLRLIDRVIGHQAAETGEPANTAAADWIAAQPRVRYGEAAHADPLPEYLSVSEAKHLIAFLSNARPRPSAVGSGRDDHEAFTWQELRNRVSVSLQLGAGLTPGDVRLLTLHSPTVQGGRSRERPWKVAVPGNGNAPARETPIAPWAGELLQHWLQVRAEMKIAGDYLFPATRSGKPWSKEAQYKAAKLVFEEAGLDGTEGGSFRLRHTFALRQLRRGTDAVQVARWLGVEPEAMAKYRRVVTSPEQVI